MPKVIDYAIHDTEQQIAKQQLRDAVVVEVIITIPMIHARQLMRVAEIIGLSGISDSRGAIEDMICARLDMIADRELIAVVNAIGNTAARKQLQRYLS